MHGTIVVQYGRPGGIPGGLPVTRIFCVAVREMSEVMTNEGGCPRCLIK